MADTKSNIFAQVLIQTWAPVRDAPWQNTRGWEWGGEGGTGASWGQNVNKVEEKKRESPVSLGGS